MKKPFLAATVAISAIIGGIVLSSPVYAQSATDLFDQSQGGTILSASPTIPGFEAIGIIGGATTGENNAGNTIFNNLGTAANPNFVNFRTPNAVTIVGIRLFTLQDGNSPDRGTSIFNFFADTNGNGIFDEAALVANVNPIDTFGSSNTYFFNAPITASLFRAEFVGNTGVTFAGPRVVELDAIAPGAAAPEPSSFALALLVSPVVIGGIRKRLAKRA